MHELSIYIYIYIRVCVCMCVRARAKLNKKIKKISITAINRQDPIE